MMPSSTSPSTGGRLRIKCHRPPVTHYPSPITHYPSPITHYPSPITHYPPPATLVQPRLVLDQRVEHGINPLRRSDDQVSARVQGTDQVPDDDLLGVLVK